MIKKDGDGCLVSKLQKIAWNFFEQYALLNTHKKEKHMNSSSNNKALYFFVGALLIAVIGMGAVMYKNQVAEKPALSIELGEDGLDVETN